MEHYDRVYASIDLRALLHNLENMYANLAAGTKMIAVVKANAYGHGALSIAQLIEEKEYIWGFAVATIEEAVELRTGGIKKPILILGYVFPKDYEYMVQEHIRPAVFSLEMAEQMNEKAKQLDQPLKIHLALDTGMTRIGFRNLKESLDEIIHIKKLSHLELEGMFTHFATADEEDVSFVDTQFKKFQEFQCVLEEHHIKIPLLHCNNSAGILWNRKSDLQAVRPGIAMYGIYPSDEVNRNGVTLSPIMSLRSHISYVKDVEAGIPVGYGGTFVTSRENTRVATIPVGYADGYPRGLSNKGYVLIHGKKAPIIGRICMDQFMVDVTDIPQAKQGDSVTLLGKDGDAQIFIEELSRLSGRFPYEFLCCITERVPRIYQK